MCVKIWNAGCMPVAVSLLLLVFASGCGTSTGVDYDDGRLYFINNTHPRPPEQQATSIFVKDLAVIFEGELYPIPFNMDHERNPTGAGLVELTAGGLPLLGGTRVSLICQYEGCGGLLVKQTIELIIDGNVTVEAYVESWEDYDPLVRFNIIPGRWSGIHHYS